MIEELAAKQARRSVCADQRAHGRIERGVTMRASGMSDCSVLQNVSRTRRRVNIAPIGATDIASLGKGSEERTDHHQFRERAPVRSTISRARTSPSTAHA